MTRITIALGIALALLWSSPSSAFETPLQSPSSKALVEQIGKSYLHYAKDLGCDQFAWGTLKPDGSLFTLKYLPAGDTLANWKTMVVITVYGMTGNNRKDAVAITNEISLLEGQYIKYANVSEDKNYLSMLQEPMLFLQYSSGTGLNMMYGAAVYMRSGPSSAAFIQFQSRGQQIPPETALKVHQMVNPTAKLPVEVRKPGGSEQMKPAPK